MQLAEQLLALLSQAWGLLVSSVSFVLSWVNENVGLVQAVLTCVLVWITKRYADETRRMRENQEKMSLLLAPAWLTEQTGPERKRLHAIPGLANLSGLATAILEVRMSGDEFWVPVSTDRNDSRDWHFPIIMEPYSTLLIHLHDVIEEPGTYELEIRAAYGPSARRYRVRATVQVTSVYPFRCEITSQSTEEEAV